MKEDFGLRGGGMDWLVLFVIGYSIAVLVTPLLGRGRGEASSPRRLVSANATGGAARVAQLTPGQFIEHERFGVGEVIKVEGTGENTKAHIRFKNAGDKQLLLKFARFRVLG